MEFEYTFYRDYENADSENYTLEVSNKELFDAMVVLYSDKSKTLEEQIKDVCGELQIETDDFEKLIKYIDACVGECDNVVDDLESYFRDKAYDEFIG